MPNIVHRIEIEGTTSERVYQTVATREGIASWWIENVNGESTVGNALQFRFGKGGPDFQVLELTPPTRGALEMRGRAAGVDRYAYPLRYQSPRRGDDAAIQALRMEGGSRIMHHCSTQWAYFLIGLKQLVEVGQGRPYGPRFEPISRWSR